MTTGATIALIVLVTVVAVFLLRWGIPAWLRQRAERALGQLEAMYRYARRHNTFVRRHSVSRARLLRALGEGGEALLLKAEGEENRHGPTPTFTTAVA